MYHLIMLIFLLISLTLTHFTEAFRKLTIEENIELQKQCGTSSLNPENVTERYKIAFGNDANSGDFPWAVMIVVDSHDHNDLHICTGSIISSWHIITAAHCIIQKSNYTYTVVGGTVCTYEIMQGMTKDRLIECKSKNYSKVFESKGYIVPKGAATFWSNSSTVYTDFAIIELQSSIDYGHLMRPICLASTIQMNLSTADQSIIYGFGNTDISEDDTSMNGMLIHNTILKWIFVHECNTTNRSYCEYTNFELNITICKRYTMEYCPIAEQNICGGDSGAGLERIIDNKHILYGVLSGGSIQSCRTDLENDFIKNVIIFANLIPFNKFICHHTGICSNGYDLLNDSDSIDAIYGTFDQVKENQMLKVTSNMSHERDHGNVTKNGLKHLLYNNNLYIITFIVYLCIIFIISSL